MKHEQEKKRSKDMSSGRRWALGDAFTLVDIFLAVYLQRLEARIGCALAPVSVNAHMRTCVLLLVSARECAFERVRDGMGACMGACMHAPACPRVRANLRVGRPAGRGPAGQQARRARRDSDCPELDGVSSAQKPTLCTDSQPESQASPESGVVFSGTFVAAQMYGRSGAEGFFGGSLGDVRFGDVRRRPRVRAGRPGGVGALRHDDGRAKGHPRVLGAVEGAEVLRARLPATGRTRKRIGGVDSAPWRSTRGGGGTLRSLVVPAEGLRNSVLLMYDLFAQSGLSMYTSAYAPPRQP